MNARHADDRPLRIGLIGAGFMAKAHSLAFTNLAFGATQPPIELVRVCDVDLTAAQTAAERYGWRGWTGNFTDITQADDIDAVDIVTPNFAHDECALDAAAHGKHILCEKPLASDLDTCRRMWEAVRDSGVINQVGFVYRSWPAVALAREMLDAGELGQLLRFRGHYFHDYALDRSMPLSWRFRADQAGAGSIGDIGSHVIDIARYLVGEIEAVCARSKTYIPERPQLDGSTGLVDVDDSTDMLVEFEGSVPGVIEASWLENGYKTDLGFELIGDRGSVRFSWQRPNELSFYSSGDASDRQGHRAVVIGPQHPNAGDFWPVAGQGMGWGDAFVIAVRKFVDAVATGRPAVPDFFDGLRAAQVVSAAQQSARDLSWTPVPSASAIRLAPVQG